MTPPICIIWTAEKVELLKKLVADGVPYTEIGLTFGVTRSSIGGKVSRLKLPSRRYARHRPTMRSQAASAITKKFREQRYGKEPRGGGPIQRIKRRLEMWDGEEVCDLAPDTSEHACTFLARTGWTCRYPLNDVMPITAHMVCNAPCDEEQSYCARHARVCTADRTRSMGMEERAHRSASAKRKQAQRARMEVRA